MVEVLVAVTEALVWRIQHNASFSLLLMNRPKKLDRFLLANLSGAV